MLSKNMMVVRSLIEEMTRRPVSPKSAADSRAPGDVTKAIKLLKTTIEDGRPVLILADGGRFATDFTRVTGIKGRHVWSEDQCRGLADCNVIILHTGGRSSRQQELYNETHAILKRSRGNDFWHIGEWSETA